MKRYLLLVFALFAMLQTSAQQVGYGALRTGDLLFCTDSAGQLSSAIDRATRTALDTRFSHVAIVERESDTLWVIHAAPGKGVCRETIGAFLQSEQPWQVDVYRLRRAWQPSVAPAIGKAKQLLGQPYNFTYRLPDEGLYCSELIWQIFRDDDIFALAPMSFNDAATGELIPGWDEHYRKLGMAVPQGEPGCNPNGMATSKKIKRVGVLKNDR